MKQPYVVKLACHHSCWTNPTERTPDVKLEVFGVTCNSDSTFGIAKMSGDEKQKKKLYEMIKNHHYTLEARKKSRDHFFIRVKKDTSFYAKLISNDYVASNNIPIHDGVEIEEILGFSKKALMNSISRIREEREVKIKSIVPFTENALTLKEQKLLNIAIKYGYYNIPRKVYAVELGEKIGIKKSTVLERLRKIEKKVIEGYVQK